MSKTMTGTRSGILASATLAALGTMAAAATSSWEFDAGGNWITSDGTPWVGDVVAEGSGATAFFNGVDITATRTVALTAPLTIGNLYFGDTATGTAASWTVSDNANPANALTLAGATPTITVDALGTNGVVTISAKISGTNGLVKNGTGTITTGVLALSGANDYSGGTTISSGAIRAQSSAALGTGPVTVANLARLQLQGGINIGNAVNINGGSALLSNSGVNTVSGLVTLQSNATIAGANAGSTSLTVTNVTLGGNVLTANTGASTSGPVTISGVITGTGASGITKTNDGVLTLNSDQTSTYSGTTTISRGNVALNADGAMGTGTFAFTVSNDTTGVIRSTNGSARTIANAMTITGGTANSVATFGSSGTGDLTFNGGITLSSIRRIIAFNAITFGGDISGGGGGINLYTGTTGLLVLKGNNTHTGATTVTAGRLLVNNSAGSGTGTNTVTASAGTGLGGFGRIGGATTISGTLQPGDATYVSNVFTSGTESLAFGSSLAMSGAAASMIFDIDGTVRGAAASGYDAVDVTGALTYAGSLTLDSSIAMAPGTYNLLDFASYSGALTAVQFSGGFYGATFSTLPAYGIWTATEGLTTFKFTESTGDLVVAIPEPAGLSVLAGFALLAAGRRRR